MTSKAWLEERGIAVIGSQGKGNQEPIVQRWMPLCKCILSRW